MKPPLGQIASQISKVEMTWPAILPLPRVSPLMLKVASMLPNLPMPMPGANTRGSGLVTPVLPIDIFKRAPVAPSNEVTPIFESVFEEPPPAPPGLIPLAFE